MKAIQSEGGEGEKLHRKRGWGGAGVKMRESFLSCLSALASQSVIQSIPQTEAFFFPLPLDVLYLAGVSLQLGIKPWFGNKINNILPKLKHKFNCLQCQAGLCK